MRFLAVMICLTLASSAPLVAAAQQESSVMAFSVVAGKTVNVNIVKVERTPMSYQDFRTLITGTNF